MNNIEEIKKIIDDYEFACIIAKRYKNYTLSGLYELYDILGYHCYNFYSSECDNLFYMEIGNLTLTYIKECGGIDNAILVWIEEDWMNTTIQELKDVLNKNAKKTTTMKHT